MRVQAPRLIFCPLLQDLCEVDAAHSRAAAHLEIGRNPNLKWPLEPRNATFAVKRHTWHVFTRKVVLFSVFCLSCPFLAVYPYFVDKLSGKKAKGIFGRMTTFFEQSLLTKKKQCFGPPRKGRNPHLDPPNYPKPHGVHPRIFWLLLYPISKVNVEGSGRFILDKQGVVVRTRQSPTVFQKECQAKPIGCPKRMPTRTLKIPGKMGCCPTNSW